MKVVSDKPIALVQLPKLEPQQDVISVLRDLLAKAEEGKIRAVGAAVQFENHATGTIFAMGDGSDACLVYACELLKYRLLSGGTDA